MRQVVCLGITYDCSEEAAREQFLEDFRSRVLLTYRSGLESEPFEGHVIRPGVEASSGTGARRHHGLGFRPARASNSFGRGWGCMLRVTQMMLAQCFVTLTLGREWRFQEEDLKEGSTYLRVASCFLDTPEALFSLHRMVEMGQRILGKEPSTWFGPTSAAQAVGHLFQEAKAAPDFLKNVGCAVFVARAAQRCSTRNEAFWRSFKEQSSGWPHLQGRRVPAPLFVEAWKPSGRGWSASTRDARPFGAPKAFGNALAKPRGDPLRVPAVGSGKLQPGGVSARLRDRNLAVFGLSRLG